MKHPDYSRLVLFFFILGWLVILPACNFNPTPAGKPTVAIAFPQAGSALIVGQAVMVESVAADSKGISRVELWVDGQLVHTQTAAPAAASYRASQPWTPAIVGSHVIEVRVFNVDNTSGDPTQVMVAVAEPTAVSAPVEVAATAAPLGDSATATIVSSGGDTATAVPPASPTATPGSSPLVTALNNLNVRAGPGTEYPVIGSLGANQSTQITGRNAAGTWWQILYPAGGSGRGWVSANQQYTTAQNAAGVPAVEAPPPPTATPAPTNTPLPPAAPTATSAPRIPVTPLSTAAATAQASKPTIYTFTADRYTINAGESVNLRWDLANAKAAYLRYDGKDEGITSPGSKTVAPAGTTAFTLIARSDGGETTASLTIIVNGTVSPTAPSTTPVYYHPDNNLKGVVQANGIYLEPGRQMLFSPGLCGYPKITNVVWSRSGQYIAYEYYCEPQGLRGISVHAPWYQFNWKYPDALKPRWLANENGDYLLFTRSGNTYVAWMSNENDYKDVETAAVELLGEGNRTFILSATSPDQKDQNWKDKVYPWTIGQLYE